MKSVTIYDQEYEYLSWQEVGEGMFDVAQQILSDGRKIDRVIALAKGGLTFSRAVADYLCIKDISSIQIEFYTGIGTTAKTPVITQSLPVSVRDQNILIFDDVVDKGDTMKMAVEYLKYHGVKHISTAALSYKPWSSFAVDFYALKTKAWVIFPHETRETIEILRKMWSKKGDNLATIQQNLLKIGIPKAEVEFFLNLA